MIKKTVILIMIFGTIGYTKVNFLPLVDAYLAHGNVFYEEKAGTPSINYNVDFVPALVLSDRTSILPRIGSSYTGILIPKEIQDEGNIYLQLLDNLVFLKWIHKRESGWTYRIELGSKKELARETADEEWGKGLYDYDTTHSELSVEKTFGKSSSIRVGVRSFTTIFPNYDSLAAETTKYLELGGKDVLDTTNGETFISLEWLLGEWFLKCRASTLKSDYTDQKLISHVDGSFLSDMRQDNYSDVSIGVSHVLPEYKISGGEEGKQFKTFIGINFSNRTKTSNQNHFDVEAKPSFGQENYYSYTQTSIAPSLTFRFLPSNVDVGIVYNITNKNYTDRVRQDENGKYIDGEKVTQNSTITNLKVAFPILQKFQAYISGSYKTAQSNMQYEKFYQYNFTAYSYLLGVSYEY